LPGQAAGRSPWQAAAGKQALEGGVEDQIEKAEAKVLQDVQGLDSAERVLATHESHGTESAAEKFALEGLDKAHNMLEDLKKKLDQANGVTKAEAAAEKRRMEEEAKQKAQAIAEAKKKAQAEAEKLESEAKDALKKKAEAEKAEASKKSRS